MSTSGKASSKTRPPKAQARWQLQKRLDPDPFLHLCANRHFDPTAVEPDFSAHMHDPNLLPDMKKAREIIKQARAENWPVVIFGDYDADGTPAAAVLSLLCDALAIPHQVRLPTRSEGYGLRPSLITEIAKEAKLLITVDNGITAVEEIKLAKEKGLTVIVLDHHIPGQTLPPADALVDPFLPSSTYPFPHLCGCALAYKLVEALSADFPKELSVGFRKWLLDLVAISTVADMMPMNGENRVLVHYGLKVLAKNRRVGLAALCATAGINPEQASSGTLGFALGPRFNASGRMGDNLPMLELLLAKDTRVAQKLAEAVEEANKQRQLLVGRIQEEAEELLFFQNNSDDRCFVVVGDGWPGGVVGLVAGRLASRWSRPVIVGTKLVDGLIRASARSIPEYSIIDALNRCSEQLVAFGGHHGAAGLSVKTEALAGFLDELKRDAAKQLAPEQLIPLHVADLQLTPAEVALETALAFQKLAPFGIGNVQPLCLLTDVVLGEPKSLGANGTHYKWQARVGDQSLEVIGFGAAAEFKTRPLTTAHLLGHLEPNYWNNQTRLQFRLVDYRPTDHPIEQLA